MIKFSSAGATFTDDDMIRIYNQVKSFYRDSDDDVFYEESNCWAHDILSVIRPVCEQVDSLDYPFPADASIFIPVDLFEYFDFPLII